MHLDIVGDVMLFTFALALVLVVWALVEFILELRRRGSTPWTEWYNDRVGPMYRGRGRPVS